MQRLLLLATVCCAHIGIYAADPGTKAPGGFAPNDVEVRLRDGSVVRGEVAGSDSIALKTPYGVLTFPLSRILRIKAGYRLAKQKEVEILAAIKDLDSDDFNTRGQAQRTLEDLGAPAIDVLREARNKASAEARNRIDAITKKIMATAPKLVTDDLVKSDEFQAAGALQFDALLVKSRIGDLKVKLEDIDSVRWLANGVVKSLALEARAGLDDWVDTGVDAIAGDKLAITAAGSVNLFNNWQSGPEGTNNWGQQPFLTGAVIGKLGAGGKPFLIGPARQWIAESSERLFVKIFASENAMNNNNNPSQGEYKLQIASGVWAEELPAAGESEAAPGEDEQLQGQVQGLVRRLRRIRNRN